MTDPPPDASHRTQHLGLDTFFPLLWMRAPRATHSMGELPAHPDWDVMPRRLLFRLLASAPRATDHVPDAELLRRFVASNDSTAFELIVHRHADAVWAACRRLLGSDADADDAFQATFLALIRKARTVRTTSAGGWLHRVAVRTSLHLRARTRRTGSVEPGHLANAPAPVVPEPDAERASLVHEELARLPERERLPVVLCDLEGMTHGAAATALGWSVGTVSSRLSRARAKLRERLTRRGLAPSAALLPALVAPPRLIHSALSLTAGAPPAVVALTDGVLAMMVQSTWKWVAVVVVGAGALGAGGVLALAPDGSQPPSVRPPGASPAVGQPIEGKENVKTAPGFRPYYTAFPDLNIRTREEFEKKFDLPPLPVLGTDPPTLRKLQFEQFQEALAYVERLEERIRMGTYSPDEFLMLIQMETRCHRVAAELEDTVAKRIPWYEASVRRLKELERYIQLRVNIGTDPPQRLHQVRFERLQAEADLFKLKNEAASPRGR